MNSAPLSADLSSYRRTLGLVSTLAVILGGITPALLQAQTKVTLVALTTDQAPGTTVGTTFSTFQPPSINNQGKVVFYAVVAGIPVNSTNNLGIWLDSGGTTSLIVREGDTPPGVPFGGEYDTFFTPAINSSGAMAFPAFLRGFTTTSTFNIGMFYRDPSGVFSLVTRTDQVAPGTTDTFTYITPNDTPGLSDDGAMAFDATLSGGGNAIYRGPLGSLNLIAQSGDPAPLGTFTGVTSPHLSANGNLIFNGGTTYSGGSEFIWAVSPVGLFTQVAREGQFAPGFPIGVSYGSYMGGGTINNAGRVCFHTELSGTGVNGTNDVAVMSSRSGSTTRMFRKGETAPETTATIAAVYRSGIGPANHIVSRLGLTGTGVTSNNDIGLWIVDNAGAHLLIREGDNVNLGAAGTKTLSGINILRSCVNDKGVVVAQASFTDGYQAILKLQRDGAAPRISIVGKKKITTTKPAIKLHGVASDDTTVARVEWRRKGTKKFKTAVGTNVWKFKGKLDPGKNQFQVRAIDTSGKISTTAKVTVIQK